jgi:dTDP-4-dehydrorhamnose reductase
MECLHFLPAIGKVSSHRSVYAIFNQCFEADFIKMAEKILITGASGFIGGKLLKSFNGSDVVGTILNSTIEGDNLVRIDLSDRLASKKMLEELKPTVIYHLAGMTSPKKNSDNPEVAYRSHITAVENILNNIDPETCHLIFLSTDKVFDGSDPYPDETSKTSPAGLYGELKLKCEQLIAQKMKKYHILRLSVVHSKGDPDSNSVIDSAILKLMKKEKIGIFKNVLRCFADVTELVEALQKLVGNSDYGTYHYGSDLVSYHDRLVGICERKGIDYREWIEGTDGQVHPLVQNFNTNRFKSLKL